MSEFIWGALAMGCFVSGLFFLRYWRLTRDRLFLFFVLAFWLFAADWTVASTVYRNDGPETYVLRLLGFSLIIIGIIDKNRRT